MDQKKTGETSNQKKTSETSNREKAGKASNRKKAGEIVNRKNIGKNIRELRHEKGMTQAKLAEMTGVSANHISHIETGTGAISIKLVSKISQALVVTPNDVLAGEFKAEDTRSQFSDMNDINWEDVDLEDLKRGGKKRENLTREIINYENLTPSDKMLLQYIIDLMEKRNE